MNIKLKVDLTLNDFNPLQTGGGCMALTYTSPEGYEVWITDNDCGIPNINDTNILIGVYPSDQAVSDGDHIALFEGITVDTLHATLAKIPDIIAEDLTLSNLPINIGLSSLIDRVVVVYDTKHHCKCSKLFDVSGLEWTPRSMKEELHRILGHPNFTITGIYY